MNKIVMLMTAAASAALFLSCSFTRAAEDPRDSDSPFGVLAFVAWDHDWNKYHFGGDKVERGAALMKEAGIRFVRMDFLWADIEPKQNEFDFAKYDRIVETLTRYNIKILGLLEYTPPWQNKRWNAPPDPALYVKFATAVVKRYKDKVKYWEIWNEPDSPSYWSPQDDMKTYTVLLKTVYPALKKEDSTCKVLMGGLADTYSIRLKQIYKNGGKDYFDIVNIHPFMDPLMPNAIGKVRNAYRGVYKQMEASGDAHKEIWLTELGCPGVVTPTKENGWWQGMSPTEQGQAEWVETVYTKCLEWKGVKKVFWAFFRDTPGHFKNGVDYFGLIRDDFSKKPAFEAYKKKAVVR